MGFTFWTFRPIDHNHPHGENSVAAITFPEKYVHLILHLFMDHVRDGEIQGRSFVFLKVHCPCILPSLT